jgi:hypothetical protein
LAGFQQNDDLVEFKEPLGKNNSVNNPHTELMQSTGKGVAISPPKPGTFNSIKPPEKVKLAFSEVGVTNVEEIFAVDAGELHVYPLQDLPS